MEVVLAVLRKSEPVAVLARRYGVSDATLHVWKNAFLEGGKTALEPGKSKNDTKDRKIAELERELQERDCVIGELTIVNRILKKAQIR